MVKLTLDMNTFKALASDTRLDILKVLDGKHMSLKDISSATNLNKATLHEHLCKLNEAGLVKRKERDGHKWVYYKLTWKGECLLHPENTKIVVLFCSTFLTLFVGIVQLVNYAKGVVVGKAYTILGSDTTAIYGAENKGFFAEPTFTQAPVANIPTYSQTTHDLSQAVSDNIGIRTLSGGSPSPADIDWSAAGSSASDHASQGVNSFVDNIHLEDIVTSSGTDKTMGDSATYAINGNYGGSNVPMAQIGIWHNPELQIIGIVLISVFCILLGFSIWRYYKNRKIKI